MIPPHVNYSVLTVLVITKPATGFVHLDFNSCLFWGMWQSHISGWAGSWLTSLSSVSHTGSIFTALIPPPWLPLCPLPPVKQMYRLQYRNANAWIQTQSTEAYIVLHSLTAFQSFPLQYSLCSFSNLWIETWLLQSNEIFWGSFPKF